MSIQRPRRIFKSSSRSHPSRGGGLGRTVLVSALGAAGGSALVLLGLSGNLFGRNTPGPDSIEARAADVAVIDGDTLRLGNTIVRLSDVTAPVRGQACAAGPDCGGRATAVLAGLVHDRDVQCAVIGHDSQGRPIGRCSAGDQDVSTAMVSAGWARASDRTLAEAERDARARRRGLWLDD